MEALKASYPRVTQKLVAIALGEISGHDKRRPIRREIALPNSCTNDRSVVSRPGHQSREFGFRW